MTTKTTPDQNPANAEQTQTNNTMNTPTPSELKIFAFDSSAVRVIMRNEEPWFIAKDICKILEIENARDALLKLDADEKGVGLTDTLGGTQEHNIISESGMYFLAMRCRNACKPGHVAHSFRKWVTSEVLPALRKTGTYTAPGAPAAAAEPTLPVPEGSGFATDSFIKAMIAAVGHCLGHLKDRITGIATRTDKLEAQVRTLTQQANTFSAGFHQHTRWINKIQEEAERNMFQTLSTDQLLNAFGEMTQNIRKMNQIPTKRN